MVIYIYNGLFKNLKLSTTHIVFIVQSILILVLFFVVIFKKSPEPIPFDYNRIKTRSDMDVLLELYRYFEKSLDFKTKKTK